jgi:phage baseplate assembly protein W
LTQQRELLKDIRLILRDNRLRPVYQVDTDTRRVPNRTGRHNDIGTVTGRDNLGQAIMMRLLTPTGELAPLGHPEYGSRLHELVGRENTETNRNLARLYILQSLQMEPRIAEIEEVLVEQDQEHRVLVNVQLKVRPTDGTGTVIIGPFALEFES